jgi:hypothetical protein
MDHHPRTWSDLFNRIANSHSEIDSAARYDVEGGLAIKLNEGLIAIGVP